MVKEMLDNEGIPEISLSDDENPQSDSPVPPPSEHSYTEHTNSTSSDIESESRSHHNMSPNQHNANDVNDLPSRRSVLDKLLAQHSQGSHGGHSVFCGEGLMA